MVPLAGGREVLGRAGAPSYATSWEAVRKQRPELIVVAPCGFDHDRAAHDASPLEFDCRTVAVDSNAYYARPAPRVADGVAQLGREWLCRGGPLRESLRRMHVHDEDRPVRVAGLGKRVQVTEVKSGIAEREAEIEARVMV
jgi:hypothetical protein